MGGFATPYGIPNPSPFQTLDQLRQIPKSGHSDYVGILDLGADPLAMGATSHAGQNCLDSRPDLARDFFPGLVRHQRNANHAASEDEPHHGDHDNGARGTIWTIAELGANDSQKPALDKVTQLAPWD
jgi:hypothetical protein